MKIRGIVILAVLLAAVGNSAQGQNPYGKWKNGPPADPGYFPIAVWLQDPVNAAQYKAAGINLYVGLWDGPTDQQLGELTRRTRWGWRIGTTPSSPVGCTAMSRTISRR
jgi:hypothetical protein